MSNNTKPSSPTNPQPQAGGTSSGHSQPPQVAEENSALRAQMDDALKAKAQGIQVILDEYQVASQDLADQASVAVYTALSGNAFFAQVAANVGMLMARHPRGPRHQITTPSLRPVSYRPLPEATSGNYLTSTAEPSSTK